MKVMKLALLGTAALAAVSVSARADDLSDLKAQIEALNARIATLESAPSVPAGYNLMTVTQAPQTVVPGYLNDKEYDSATATTIGILPTADVPASTTVQWTGFVRVGLVYDDADVTVVAPRGPLDINLDGDTLDAGEAAIVGVFKNSSLDLLSRAGIKVVGTTETAVGEVGVRVALLASVETRGGVNRSHDSSVASDGYWGWWKITPELTLGGGVDGSLGNSSNAFDNRCTCHYINTGGAFGHNDPTQLRLSYDSGPISFAVAVEDEGHSGIGEKDFGFAGELKWNGDAVGFDVSAAYWAEDAWTVNVGAKFAFGDMVNVGVAVGAFEDHVGGRANRGSVFLGFNLSDAVAAELGATYTDEKGIFVDSYTIAGGLYYNPVSQLQLGLEASHTNPDGGDSNNVIAAITKWSF